MRPDRLPEPWTSFRTTLDTTLDAHFHCIGGLVVSWQKFSDLEIYPPSATFRLFRRRSMQVVRGRYLSS